MASAHVDNRPYCAKHDTHYSALTPCAGCADDPAPAVAVEQETPANPRLLESERVYREDADTLREFAHHLLEQRRVDKNKDSQSARTIVLAFAESAKIRTRHDELVADRSKQEYMRDLMAHEQIMAGLRKAH